jgi:hypothetical protein
MTILTTSTNIGRNEYIAVAVLRGSGLHPKSFGLGQANKTAAALGEEWGVYGQWPYMVARPA